MQHYSPITYTIQAQVHILPPA